MIYGCSHSGSNSSVPPTSSQVVKQQRVDAVHVRHSGKGGFVGIPSSLLVGWADAQVAAEKRGGNRAIDRSTNDAFVARKAAGLRSLALTPSSGAPRALVLYDIAGQYGFLGELYAMAVANLVGHFGSATTEPVSAYTAGQVDTFDETIYIGSTYYTATSDAIPQALYTDVAASAHKVMWMNDNIWNFANAIGVANFKNEYGWDPTNSFFAPGGSIGNVTSVTYKNQNLPRTIPAGGDGGILHPYVLGGTYPAVQTLAIANDSSTSPATTFPWAIKSRNLTYLGEIPFSYLLEADRALAFDDMLFDALAPVTPERHRALVRLEDLSANDDPAQLMQIARYLSGGGIPFSFTVIPLFTDPLGYYNNGVPQTIHLSDAPNFVKVVKYMLAHGGTMVDEGYTHQYKSKINPYDGVSGDDAEFFLTHVDAGNNVVWDGPPPEDSFSWAQGRIDSALAEFASVGIPAPKLWLTPHYFGTDVDYKAAASRYGARYERSLYFAGTLSGAPVNYGTYIGQMYPYVATDVYGTKVLPENLGDYEPVSENNHPIRLPADIIAEAKRNLVVRDGFASFFYDPSYGVTPLQQTITGIGGLGYNFISASSL